MVNNKRKPHFQVSSEKRRLNKHEIRKKLTEFNNYLSSMGLALCSKETIQIKLYDETNNLENFKIKISNEFSKDSVKQNSVLSTLFVADSVNLSQQSYYKIRKDLQLKDQLPAYNQVEILKKRIHSFFKLEMTINRNGFFLKHPLEKVEFVLKKVLSNLKSVSEQIIIENKTFIIKISGDGKVLTKSSSREINNIVFTVINEVNKCKTSFGNYILGKNSNRIFLLFVTLHLTFI